MKVEQFYNKNQFLIKGNNKIVFQSYDSTIAILEDGDLTLGVNWDYSSTTLRHLYKFLEEYYCTNEIEEALSKNNKKQAIQKLIDNDYIEYNEYLY